MSRIAKSASELRIPTRGRTASAELAQVAAAPEFGHFAQWAAANGITPATLVKAVQREAARTQSVTSIAASLAPDPNMGAPFTSLGNRGIAAQMGPGEAASPFPLGGDPRQFTYRVGWNFPTPPESDRAVDPSLLRTLGDSFDLMRRCFEIRKAEISALDWDIVPVEKNRRKREKFVADNADDIARIKQTFEWPEGYFVRDAGAGMIRRGKVRWESWLNALLDDYFVLDSLTIWPKLTLGGKIIGFDRVDGALVKPLLDIDGRIPEPPMAAYQTYQYGVPRASFTFEELLYRPRNVRNFTPYGFSHVEQALVLINLALRFQIWQTAAYTDSALPLGLLEFPENYAPEQIEVIVDQLNNHIAGLAGSRQQFHGVPSGVKWNAIKPFDWDETFAQFLVEYTCAMCDVKPLELGFMPGRGGKGLGGTGMMEGQSDSSRRQSFVPTARWIKGVCCELIQRYFGRSDLEFVFVGIQEENDAESVETDQKAMFAGIKSMDEILQDRGEDPVGVDRFVVIGNVPWSIADLKAIQDPDTARTAAPGLVMSEEPEPPVPPPGMQPALPPGPQPQDGGEGQRALPPAGPDKPGEKQPPKQAEQTTEMGGDGEATHGGKTEKTFDTSSGFQPHGLVQPDDGDVKDELRRWKRMATKAMREGRTPRPFETAVIPEQVKTVIAERLERAASVDEARAIFDTAIGKAAERNTVAAGLVVKADDTGRVLMLQRALADDDPAAGKWEFPGGMLEDGETPLEGALREWAEETGLALPDGELRGHWRDGLYEAFVYVIAHEADLDINADHEDRAVLNPDDPDGDMIETVAWWEPQDLPGMPALRDEVNGSDWDAIRDATLGRRLAKVAGLALGKTAGTRENDSHLRKQRTEEHEKQAAAAVAALYARKAREARAAKPLTRDQVLAILSLDAADVAELTAALHNAKQASYLAGANRILARIGLPPLDKIPHAALQQTLEQASHEVQGMAGAYHTNLGNQVNRQDRQTSREEVPTTVRWGLVAAALAPWMLRQGEWRGKQLGVTGAATAYNLGALDIIRAQPRAPITDEADGKPVPPGEPTVELGRLKVQWQTAEDDRVCEDCADLDGQVFWADDAADLIPLHEQCRCEWNDLDPGDPSTVTEIDPAEAKSGSGAPYPPMLGYPASEDVP